MEFLKKHYYTNARLLEMLKASASNGHLCHTYMLFGPNGSGKLTIARYFAAAILCRGGDKPCGVCESCNKLEIAAHPDYYEYSGKQGRDSIHIEEIRRIRQEAYILPNDSDYKVYVIPNAEDMTASASNAFLKLLEEPPKHAVFILTAISREAMLPTVCSRSMMLEVFPAKTDELIGALQTELPDVEITELERAAELSDGIIGKAKDILADEGSKKLADEADKAIEAISQNNEYAFLLAASNNMQSREAAVKFTDCIYHIIRKAILLKATGKCGSGTAEALKNALSLKKLYGILNAIEKINSSNSVNINLSLYADCITAEIFKIIK